MNASSAPKQKANLRRTHARRLQHPRPLMAGRCPSDGAVAGAAEATGAVGFRQGGERNSAIMPDLCHLIPIGNATNICLLPWTSTTYCTQSWELSAYPEVHPPHLMWRTASLFVRLNGQSHRRDKRPLIAACRIDSAPEVVSGMGLLSHSRLEESPFSAADTIVSGSKPIWLRELGISTPDR